MTEALQFRALRVDDEPLVAAWMGRYLQDHVAGWVEAHGLAWSADDVRRHVVGGGLVEREVAALYARDPAVASLVEVAVKRSEPIGIVHAERTIDAYLALPMGVVSWVYVAPSARRQGIGGRLLERAITWMVAQKLVAAEVFVTVTNGAAHRSYGRAGFRDLDRRMVMALPPGDD